MIGINAQFDDLGSVPNPLCTIPEDVTTVANFSFEADPVDTQMYQFTNTTVIDCSYIILRGVRWTFQNLPGGPILEDDRTILDCGAEVQDNLENHNPAFRFPSGGDWEVCMEVTDHLGNTTQVCQTVTVVSANPPEAAFIFSANANEVTFTDQSTDPEDDIETWLWEFGDGNTSTEEDPVHTYSESGDYQVTLTVTDSGGRSDSVTQTVSTNVAPVADFSFTRNLLQVQFTDESTDSDGTVVSWLWDFGDTNTSTDQNPTHTYAAPGSYDVTLTVTDNDGAQDSDAQTVVANNDITARLSIAPTQGNPGAPDPNAGTFAELLNVSDPPDAAAYEKSLYVVVHDIEGGDGGPYTVDFSNVNFDASGVAFTGSDPQVAMIQSDVDSGSYEYTQGMLDVITAYPGNGSPNQWTFTLKVLAGSYVEITDGSSNTYRLYTPEGFGGNVQAGSLETPQGQYQDSFNVRFNSGQPLE